MSQRRVESAEAKIHKYSEAGASATCVSIRQLNSFSRLTSRPPAGSTCTCHQGADDDVRTVVYLLSGFRLQVAAALLHVLAAPQTEVTQRPTDVLQVLHLLRQLHPPVQF
jgi:hypothetical protein